MVDDKDVSPAATPEPEVKASVKLLAAALSKFQGELESAKKDKANSFFKSSYADLRSVWDVIREPLANNGLAVVQSPKISGGKFILETTLLHSSGQYIKSQYPIDPIKNDPQGVGSALTYARRYALSAMLGVVSEDDDGNRASGRGNGAASNPVSAPAKAAAPKAKPKAANGAVINAAQAKRFYAMGKSAKKTDNELKGHLREYYGIESTRDIKKDDYDALCSWAENPNTTGQAVGQ